MKEKPLKSLEHVAPDFDRAKEAETWAPFSADFDGTVYSFTRFPRNVDRVVENILCGRVLNMGTGPTDYLNKRLVELENTVVATDFCLEMLAAAKRRFTHPWVEYRLADSRDLPFTAEFDSVLAINSILPPTREDVVAMFRSARRALKPGGVFVATLMHIDDARYLVEAHGDKWQVDFENKIEIDTNGPQCAHDGGTVYTEMRAAGWTDFHVSLIYLDTPEEIEDFKRLYDYHTGAPSPVTGKPLPPFDEILLVARK